MTTLVIEGMLIFLLLITICYCFVLDRRLKILRSGQTDLRKVITDLSQTTQTAQEAIAGLKATADDVDKKLSAKLDEARALTGQLGHFVGNQQQKIDEKIAKPKQLKTGNSIFLSKAG